MNDEPLNEASGARCIPRSRQRERTCVLLDVTTLGAAGLDRIVRALEEMAGAGMGVAAVAVCDGDLAPALTAELRARRWAVDAHTVVGLVRPGAPRRLVDEAPSVVARAMTGTQDHLASAVADALGSTLVGPGRIHVFEGLDECIVVALEGVSDR